MTPFFLTFFLRSLFCEDNVCSLVLQRRSHGWRILVFREWNVVKRDSLAMQEKKEMKDDRKELLSRLPVQDKFSSTAV